MTAPRFHIEDLTPWIDVQFARSSAPGGQNVNKVNTRVTLRFDFDNCPLLSDSQRTRLRTQLKTRLSRDGHLRVVAQAQRSQAQNRAAAQERLLELLTVALTRRKPRRPTKPTRASRERRLENKRRASARKRQRRVPGSEA